MKIYQYNDNYAAVRNGITVWADKNGAYDMTASVNVSAGEEVDINNLPHELAGSILKAMFWRVSHVK